MKSKIIRIECQGAGLMPLEEMIEFQGDLKAMSEEAMQQLKNEMIENGFNSPIHIWKPVKGKKRYILDGHQRCRALASLRDDGYKIPKSLPIDYIKAKDIKQAKHILLSRVSQYGKTTPGGLYEFMMDTNMEIEEIKSSFTIPEIDIPKFEIDFLGMPKPKESQGSTEIDDKTYSNLMHTCPRCAFKFGKGVPKDGK